ncbi:hypothetical protein QFZ40_002221 [Arthrobacter pascens]|nr:hypothetical protein [Arthrobacter pascens]
MRSLEPTVVLRPDGFRTGSGGAGSGRLSVEHRAAAPLVRERGRCNEDRPNSIVLQISAEHLQHGWLRSGKGSLSDSGPVMD